MERELLDSVTSDAPIGCEWLDQNCLPLEMIEPTPNNIRNWLTTDVLLGDIPDCFLEMLIEETLRQTSEKNVG
jgi:hypothetical protein